MNTHMQKSLDNLEASLATTLDSLISYNPSSTATRTLVAAEEAFTNDLAMVAEHQALYQKLQRLKELSDSLDTRTLELLKALEETHAELIALPPPKPSSTTADPSETSSYPANRVPYTALLDYARKIAKFTQTAQLAKATSGEAGRDVTGGKEATTANALQKDEVEFLVNQGVQNKVWPFPNEEKMKGGALGWLSTGGEIVREKKS